MQGIIFRLQIIFFSLIMSIKYWIVVLTDERLLDQSFIDHPYRGFYLLRYWKISAERSKETDSLLSVIICNILVTSVSAPEGQFSTSLSSSAECIPMARTYRVVNESVRKWMNEWMNEWNKRMKETDGTNGTKEWMNEWMNEWMDEWMNGWMNRWLSERVSEWMSEGMEHTRGKRIKT